ncbi:hypothetical protein JOC85_000720 [Bacillus mesophilus]|uniref:ATP-grasp domain-containing protein n=1 Tax=Bacillus mesophilus TaxID=1808955 RepID=A0A6M0Q3N8_9BACI|nr:YheC/YheD family protein [Bacillus mesophilus]MBM7659953.1 hypothetical protein [Bacillus mesophilus]NEY70814.1 hypothetical protein [Bacillus mesophilus]
MKLYLSENQLTVNEDISVTWGEPLVTIPFSRSEASTAITIANTHSIKPLVGILAGEHQTKSFSGNEKAFQRIQLALQKQGGLAYVFTPKGWHSDRVHAAIYDFKNNKWIHAYFPHPNVVYNRIPFRRQETKRSFQNIREACDIRNIPFFNDSFLQKSEIFEWLSKNEHLVSYLPVTKNLTNLDSFYSMMKQFKKVYLKPSSGKKGKGIIVVEQINKNEWKVETVKDSFSNIETTELIENWISPKIVDHYIIQQGIQPLKWNGTRFDYRVLVHRKNKKEFIISGIGVRQSQKQEITTHLPAGGKIIPFRSLPFQEDEIAIHSIVNEIGNTINSQSRTFGEFSIDMGKSVTGELYIFEINAKPMVFDEDDIRAQGLENLTRYFRYLSEKR